MQDKQSWQDNRIEDFSAWQAISNSNGWLVYERELKELIADYERHMDNLEASGEMLKHYQLIKKGLKLALNIPVILEVKAKTARKEKR